MLNIELLPAKTSVITLRVVFDDYKQTRQLKPRTIVNYSTRMNKYLGDWLDMPVSSLTKSMIEERYQSIPHKAMANSTMRTLRSLLYYAMIQYEQPDGSPVLTGNAVARLTELQVWHKDKRRKTVLSTQDLKLWFRAVFSLDNSTMRDFVLLLIFTGMRKDEALSLTWQEVDFAAGIITLSDTKTEDKRIVPLSDYVWRLLSIRRHGARSEFVFPNSSGSKPITAAGKSLMFIVKRSGVKFCLHDLRRTFASIADDMDVKSQVVAALVGHRSRDVTEGYTIRSTERLRRATQVITNAILLQGGLIGPSAVNRVRSYANNNSTSGIRRLSSKSPAEADNAKKL